MLVLSIFIRVKTVELITDVYFLSETRGAKVSALVDLYIYIMEKLIKRKFWHLREMNMHAYIIILAGKFPRKVIK